MLLEVVSFISPAKIYSVPCWNVGLPQVEPGLRVPFLMSWTSTLG
jgi:hypothetical protein